jgi:hypothetical protein
MSNSSKSNVRSQEPAESPVRFNASTQLTLLLSFASVCLTKNKDDDDTVTDLQDQLYALKSDHFNSLKEYFNKEYMIRDRSKGIDFNHRLQGATPEFKSFYRNAQGMATEELTSLIAQKNFEMEAQQVIFKSKKALVKENLLLAVAFNLIEARKFTCLDQI